LTADQIETNTRSHHADTNNHADNTNMGETVYPLPDGGRLSSKSFKRPGSLFLILRIIMQSIAISAYFFAAL